MLESIPKMIEVYSPCDMACFSISYLHQYLPHPVYEVPAIRVNTTKSTYTFTSVLINVYKNLIISTAEDHK